MSGGVEISDRRLFLKGLTSLPLANLRPAAAVSAGSQELTVKKLHGQTVRAGLAKPQDQPHGSTLLIQAWWGLV